MCLGALALLLLSFLYSFTGMVKNGDDGRGILRVSHKADEVK